MTKKSILIYIGGVVSGVVLTFVVLIVISMAQAAKGETSVNRDLVMFEQPQQTVEAEELEVMQVLPDGSALATIEDYNNLGTVVMFPAKEGTSYYDDQKINIPSGKCLKQVGTYRYMTRQEMEKTVPVVEIFDK